MFIVTEYAALIILYMFATVHSLIKNINMIDSCQSHLPRTIRFEYRIHSPEVTLVL